MVDGGFALVWTVVPTVGKRVFLLAVSTIPTVMRCMTPSAATVKKAAYGRSKSPAFAGTKTAANRGPSPNPPKAPPHALPKGRELHWRPLPKPSPRGGCPFPLCLRLLCGAPFPWGRLGWGLWCCSFPLGKAGMGLLCWMVRTPGNSVGVAIS